MNKKAYLNGYLEKAAITMIEPLIGVAGASIPFAYGATNADPDENKVWKGLKTSVVGSAATVGGGIAGNYGHEGIWKILDKLKAFPSVKNITPEEVAKDPGEMDRIVEKYVRGDPGTPFRAASKKATAEIVHNNLESFINRDMSHNYSKYNARSILQGKYKGPTILLSALAAGIGATGYYGRRKKTSLEIPNA